LPKAAERSESVHLALFPSAAEILGDAKNAASDADSGDESTSQDWTTLRSVRDDVLKVLEEARNNKLIGTGLEAQVTVTAPDPVYSVLSRHAPSSVTCSSCPQSTSFRVRATAREESALR